MDNLHRISYRFSSKPDQFDFLVVFWNFPVADNLSKCPHISSIFIPRVKYVDKVSVVFQFLTTIEDFHHKFTLLLREILYLSILLGVTLNKHKGVT